MRTLTIAIALTGSLLSAASATAADLGTFKDWSAQSVEEGGALVCFMTSAPKILDPGETERASGTVRISVTHRPQDQTFGTVIVGLLAGAFLGSVLFQPEALPPLLH